MNGKIVTVEKLKDLDEETTNAMTADDFLKFCDDFQVEKSPKVEEFVDLHHIKEELRNSIYINDPDDYVKKTTSKTFKPKIVGMRRDSQA